MRGDVEDEKVVKMMLREDDWENVITSLDQIVLVGFDGVTVVASGCDCDRPHHLQPVDDSSTTTTRCCCSLLALAPLLR